MPGNHGRAERLARLRAAIPPAHMLDILRHDEEPVHRGRRLDGRTRPSGEGKAFWNERDPLTGGRMTLARWGDQEDRPSGPPLLGLELPDGAARATTEERDQAEHTHQERRSPGPRRSRLRNGTAALVSTRQVHLQCRAFTNGLTTGSRVHLGGLSDLVLPVSTTCTATFMVFFSGSPRA